jgi:hypothetical protein
VNGKEDSQLNTSTPRFNIGGLTASRSGIERLFESTADLHCRALAAKLAAMLHGNVQVSYMPIGRTLREHIGLDCADEVSQRVSRDMKWSSAKGPADGVGSSSAPWYGYIAFADCASGMSGEQTSNRRSFARLLTHLLEICRTVLSGARDQCSGCGAAARGDPGESKSIHNTTSQA